MNAITGCARFFLPAFGCSVQEVSDINKQKFLAELAKLLTFMYEDDRQRALGAYSDMFEEAEDEQALLQALISPLRQAVEVARAYNSGKQTLSAESKPGENEDKNNNFMETIFRIRAEALSTQPVRKPVSEDQISLFDAPLELPEDLVVKGEEPAEEPGEAPEGEPVPEAEEEAEDPGPRSANYPEEAPAAEAPQAPAAPSIEAERPQSGKKVRKPRVFLLILYLLIAIPLTLVAVLVLLVPALLSLVAAVLCFAVAVLGVISAFGSFPKIANLLVALGAALILLAFGLIFLMLFIWLLGSAIGGLINGVITLGGKWCYKEVAVQ